MVKLEILQETKNLNQDDFYKDFYDSPVYQRLLKHFATDWYTERIKEIEVKISKIPRNGENIHVLNPLYKQRQLYIKSLALFGVEYKGRKLTNPYKK